MHRNDDKAAVTPVISSPVLSARVQGPAAVLLAFGTGLALAACGDSTDSTSSGALEARYIVHLSNDAPDGRLNYFLPVDSLAEGTTVDLSQGLEVPGTARLYAPPAGGFFSVGNSDDLTITRYDVSPDGVLTETGAVSFQNQGINRLFRTVAFIDDRKAYYLDEGNARIIVWNPEELTITGSIDVSVAARSGMDLKFVRQNYPLRPGRLITTVTWASPMREALERETGLLVIDTERDEVIRYEVDARCAGAAEVVEQRDGDIYFATGPDEVVDNTEIRGSSERPSCMLRVRAGEEHFDPDYLVQLSELVDGRVACNILPSPGQQSVLFRALDETKAEWSLENELVGLAEAWEWWRLDVQSGSARLESELGVGTVYTNYALVRDRVFLTRQTEGAAESEFIEILPEGAVRAALRAPGFLWAATQIR
jgi:hypothetical protein